MWSLYEENLKVLLGISDVWIGGMICVYFISVFYLLFELDFVRLWEGSGVGGLINVWRFDVGWEFFTITGDGYN